MDVARLLTWTAERSPDRAGVGGPAPVTYREWDSRASQIARALRSPGAPPRLRVTARPPGHRLGWPGLARPPGPRLG